VTTFLRLEGLALFGAAVVGYAGLGGSWWLFFLLILVPDISVAGYLAGSRFGALSYNAAHSTIIPLAVAAAGWWSQADVVLHLAAIWLAHIGLDRALGYGLKHQAGFNATHLGRIGRA
jgi:hypothetical protein